MAMEYITSNKGGRKLAFENNISIKQKVLSNGTVWGDIMGDFVQGDFVQGDFVRGILSGGVCPGEFCPRTISTIKKTFLALYCMTWNFKLIQSRRQSSNFKRIQIIYQV